MDFRELAATEDFPALHLRLHSRDGSPAQGGEWLCGASAVVRPDCSICVFVSIVLVHLCLSSYALHV